jgi:hypothetical protein
MELAVAVCDVYNTNVEVQGIISEYLYGIDRLSLQTLKSNYQFTVIDPFNRKGLLTGGVLGSQRLEAVLAGTISVDSTDFDSSELKPGRRAVFFVSNEDLVQRLTTSVITEIVFA